ncbi:MAG: hypothetical protein EXR50_04185 [Dehalococcoidia bacterium]|nr:hypothetical protein [Dehalococcoidia bacterium]
MEPQVIDGDSWAKLSTLLIWLYLFAAGMVTFALSTLIGHGVLPSLVATRHLPANVQSVRPVLYIFGIVALVAAIFCFSNVLGLTSVMYGIYTNSAGKFI